MSAHNLRSEDDDGDTRVLPLGFSGYGQWVTANCGSHYTGCSRTGPGRSRAVSPATAELRVETLLTATEAGDVLARNGELSREQTMIWLLCREPRSVAEVAAHLCLAYHHVRDLVREAVAQEILRVHPDACDDGWAPGPDVVARLRWGLERLV